MSKDNQNLKRHLYREREVDAVVQVSEPEEVREPVRDVKGTELLLSKIQKPQDVDVVLIASVKVSQMRVCL